LLAGFPVVVGREIGAVVVFRRQHGIVAMPCHARKSSCRQPWNLTALSGRVVRRIMPKRSLLHGLFPVVRAEVLRLLFTNPGQELYVRELTRLTFLSLQTVQDELAKLETAELISSRSNGYQRFYRANPKHPLYAALRRMVITGTLHPKPTTQARGRRGRRRRSASSVGK